MDHIKKLVWILEVFVVGNSSERQPDHIASEDQLSVHVRRFIADFVQERMLGKPSFVLTKTIVQWLSLIGLDVAKNHDENGTTLEDLCKKVRLIGEQLWPNIIAQNCWQL